MNAFLRYFYAKLHTAIEKRMYECYTADCLYYINHVLGVKMQKRYSQLIYPNADDTKTAEEIVDDISARFGLKVVG